MSFQAMILAAGYGTRLRPLTEERPKPAVPVANRPAALYTIEHLAAHGVTHMVMNTHHLQEPLQEALCGVLPAGVRLEFIHEPELLGTGGGLANAWRLFEPGPVIIMNTDILFRPDLGALMRMHDEHGAIATMVLRADPRAESFGALEVDTQGCVRRLLGQPEDVGGVGLDAYMFTGVHVLSERARLDMPSNGCIVRHSYRRWVDDQETAVAGLVSEAPWHDLGNLELYHDANMGLLSGAIDWPGFTRPSNEVLVAAGAEVHPSAQLGKTVVGAGAHIGAQARLERCVVWPGAQVVGRHSNAIITPQRVVTLSTPSCE